MATIKGKWVLNEKITGWTNASALKVSVNYTTETYELGLDAKTEGFYQVSGTEFTFYETGVIFRTDPSLVWCMSNRYDDGTYSGESGWYVFDWDMGTGSFDLDLDEALIIEIQKRIRVYDFGEVEQTVSDGFSTWWTKNATVYVDEEVEDEEVETELYGNTEVVYDNETIASLEPEEATQLDCAGKLMKTEVKVINRSKKVSSTPLEGAVPVYGENGTLSVVFATEEKSYEGQAVPQSYVDEALTEQKKAFDDALVGQDTKISMRPTALQLTLDTATYKMKAQLMGESGTVLSESNEIDFPLEMAFVDAKSSEDGTEIIFTLQSGSTVNVPVSEIAGKFNIVQETGTSTDAVMSQDATTKELDKKLDKLDPTVSSGMFRLYTMLPKGGLGQLVVASSVGSVNMQGRVPLYFVSGSGTSIGSPSAVLLTGDPIAPYDAANKKYVDGGFMAKPAADAGGYQLVPSIDHQGNQTTLRTRSYEPEGLMLAQYKDGGRLAANTPADSDDCVPLGYAIANFVAKSQVSKVGGIAIVNNILQLDTANDSEIARKATVNAPLKPRNVDSIVKVGITTNIYTLTAEEKASACRWLGVDRELALAMGKKTITAVVNSITQSFYMDNPTGYALVNKIGGYTHRETNQEYYDLDVELVGEGSIPTDEAGFEFLWQAAPSFGNSIAVSGKFMPGMRTNLSLTTWLFADNATITVTIDGSYTGYNDNLPDQGLPPRLVFTMEDGTSQVAMLFGMNKYTLNNVKGIITDINLVGGDYDAQFNATITISVTDLKTIESAYPEAIKYITLYSDEYETSVREYTIPDAILDLPYYGYGISDTVYNYIDLDEKTYVQMCNHTDALATPVVTDISSLLAEFDGVIDTNGTTSISFSRDKVVRFNSVPIKLTYHHKV